MKPRIYRQPLYHPNVADVEYVWVCNGFEGKTPAEAYGAWLPWLGPDPAYYIGPSFYELAKLSHA